MRKDEAKAIRGVWEREPGSNVWWIRYRDASGKLRREKVGRKGDAIDLLNKRRNDRRVGVKMASAKGGDPTDWPVDIRVREYPKTATVGGAR